MQERAKRGRSLEKIFALRFAEDAGRVAKRWPKNFSTLAFAQAHDILIQRHVLSRPGRNTPKGITLKERKAATFSLMCKRIKLS
jgi:hypothetical protein